MQSRPAGCIGAVYITYSRRRQVYAGRERATMRRTHPLLVGLGDHVAGHVPDALVDDLCHRGHDALRLRTVEPLALESLHEMVRVKVELGSSGSRSERPVAIDGERRSAMRCPGQWIPYAERTQHGGCSVPDRALFSTAQVLFDAHSPLDPHKRHRETCVLNLAPWPTRPNAPATGTRTNP